MVVGLFCAIKLQYQRHRLEKFILLTHMPDTSSKFISHVAIVLPWLLPALLLFSRAIADITVVLTGFVFLYYSYQTQNWRWLRMPWFGLALLFWGYLIFVNLPLSHLPGESLKYALTFIRWPLFAAALSYWIFYDEQRQRQFILSLMVVTVFIVGDTSWQYFFDVDWFGIERFNDVRLTGPFRNPVPGTLMLRVWFITLFAFQLWQLKNSHPRLTVWAYLSTLMLGLVFMFITGERMALMLFLAGSGVIFSALYIHYHQYRAMMATGLLCIGLVMYLVTLSAPDMTARSVVSIGDKLANFGASDYGHVFSAAWQVWQQNRWFGSGIHTYQQVCQQMDLFAHSAMQCTHPHNLYLQLGAETGIAGLVLFVAMLIGVYITALKGLIQCQNWLGVASSSVVLTVSFWPLTGGISVLNNWVGALVWLGVGWVLAIAATQQPALFQPRAGLNR